MEQEKREQEKIIDKEGETMDRLFYPPGGLLIWMILSIELLTFIPALIAFLVYRSQEPEVFAQSAASLNLITGTINTMVLITGGWFMAEALRRLRLGVRGLSARMLWLAAAAGLIFLIIKGYEYSNKIQAGQGLDYNQFFLLYWMITGFHYLHVLVGTLLLLIAARGVGQGKYSQSHLEDVETIGVFWHMCDLIWILVFPVIYILPRGGVQ